MEFRIKLIPILIIVVLFGMLPRAGLAQTEIEITPEDPVYTFGESISLEAFLHHTEGVDQVVLYLQPSDQTDLQVFPVALDSAGNLSTEIDPLEYSLPAFDDIRYWYQVNSTSGETYQSPVYSFTYLDNRYPWRTLTGEPFTIHWYAGDLSFGEEVLNVTLAGAKSIQELLEVFFPENLDMYVYENTQAASPSADQYWIAGHASPIQGVIMVTLPPGPDQRLEMERQIPHELMHVALSYTDSHAYAIYPVWFNEGLASLVELYPNPDYSVLIDNAFEAGELLSISSLCDFFPSDTQLALLAYAESASFTRFLYDQFGKTGFNRMMAAYASGMNCEQGIEEALGSSLEGLDESWRRTSFTSVTLGIAFQELLPWLVLLLIVLAGPLILVVVMLRNRPAKKEYDG
jgi:hypothetical protein